MDNIQFYKPNNRIEFYASAEGKPLLVIDATGFVYKGTRIEDAGQAHTAWMETMQALNHD
jgi:hypothetical protein